MGLFPYPLYMFKKQNTYYLKTNTYYLRIGGRNFIKFQWLYHKRLFYHTNNIKIQQQTLKIKCRGCVAYKNVASNRLMLFGIGSWGGFSCN